MSNRTTRILLVATALAAIGLGLLLLLNPLTGESRSDLLQFFGRFHPVVLHLPIGCIIVLALLEILSASKAREAVGAAIPYVLALSVISTMAAIGTGMLLAIGSGATQPLAHAHMRFGVLLGIAMLALAAIKLLGPRKALNVAYRPLLALVVVLLAAASHRGGAITHGSGYLTKYAPNAVRPLLGLERKLERTVERRGDLIIFADLIQPAIEQKCQSCHNPDKLEGGLSLATYADYLAGGEGGAAIVPYELGESELYRRVTLPAEHEDFMPAEEKPALSEDEIGIVKLWIQRGASEKARVSALEVLSPQVETYIADVFSEMLSPGDRKRVEEKWMRLHAELGALKEEFGVLAVPTKVGADQFSLEAFPIRASFDDQLLQKLEPYAANFVSADLSGTYLSDDGLEVLAKFENLKSLNLSKTRLSGRSLGLLANLGELESLNLYGSKIQREHLDKLAKLTQLKKLYLFQTELAGEEDLAWLRQALPECAISAM